MSSEPMTLDELLEKAVVYEDQASLHPQLRRGVHLTAIAAGAAIPISLFCVPAIVAFAYLGLLAGLGGLAALPLLLLASPLGIIVNILALGVYGWLWYKTDGLQQGALCWHRAALGLTVIGATDVLVIGLPLAWGVLSILLQIVWVIVVTVAVVVGLLLVLAVLG